MSETNLDALDVWSHRGFVLIVITGDRAQDHYWNNKYLKRDEADYDLLNRSCGTYSLQGLVQTKTSQPINELALHKGVGCRIHSVNKTQRINLLRLQRRT